MSEKWIVVPNWHKFQHYKDRSPAWVKVYTELNSDPAWLALSAAECGMLTKIWLEYARSRGRLPVEKAMQLCGKSARSAHIEALSQAGFIQLVASEPLALARSREKTLEKEKNARAKTPSKSKPKTGSRVTGWRLVRGSHGMTHVPDPNGTDKPPFDAPLKEMH